MGYFGTDPEVFSVDKRGKAVPAHLIYPDKKHPLKVHESGTLYRDGYAIELNVKAGHCREALTYKVGRLLLDIQQRGPFKFASAVPIDLKTLDGAPPDVQQFGCDASLCAYERRSKVPELEATSHKFRYAGGHMHISGHGVWMKDPDLASNYIQWCDLYAGVPMAFWFDSEDQYRRRRWYGQAGEFRLQNYPNKAYGIEYRTPPSEVWQHPMFASYVLGVMRILADRFQFQTLKAPPEPKLAAAVRAAINTGEGLKKLLPQAVIKENEWSTLGLLESVRDWAGLNSPVQWWGGEYSFRYPHVCGWDWYTNRNETRMFRGGRKPLTAVQIGD